MHWNFGLFKGDDFVLAHGEATVRTHGEGYLIAVGDGLDLAYLYDYEHCGGEGHFYFSLSVSRAQRFTDFEDAKWLASRVGGKQMFVGLMRPPA
jgi:hypothetical protein